MIESRPMIVHVVFGNTSPAGMDGVLSIWFTREAAEEEARVVRARGGSSTVESVPVLHSPAVPAEWGETPVK